MIFSGTASSHLLWLTSTIPVHTNQFGLDLAQEQQISRSLGDNLLFQKYHCGMTDTDVAPAGGYQFPMVRYTDMDEDMKKEVSPVFVERPKIK